MELDLDGVLSVVAEQAKQLAIANGRLVAMQKQATQQAEALAELAKKVAEKE